MNEVAADVRSPLFTGISHWEKPRSKCRYILQLIIELSSISAVFHVRCYYCHFVGGVFGLLKDDIAAVLCDKLIWLMSLRVLKMWGYLINEEYKILKELGDFSAKVLYTLSPG